MNIWNKLGVEQNYFGDAFIGIYNKEVARLPKAEAFINQFTDDVKEVKVGKKVYTLDMALKLYNDLISTLSRLQQQYKREYGKEMTLEEKEKGFEV